MKRKVLVVDDNEDIRELISNTLDSEDYQLFVACDTDQALQLVHDVSPHMIILDVMLPGSMNGYKLCELIKSTTKTPSIYVMLFTARGQKPDIEKGKEVGADDYLVKPFSPIKLKQKIDNLFLSLLPEY